MMWRCLVEENVKVGQVSNVGCGSEYRPMVANNRHKLEEKYKREYKDMVKEWQLWLDVICQFQDYSQLFSESYILCSAARKSSIVGDFHLDRSVPFLVNTSILSRNLLRTAMLCFVLRISSIYIELETLQRIWWWFSYWGYMSMICFHVCISSLEEQNMFSEGTAD